MTRRTIGTGNSARNPMQFRATDELAARIAAAAAASGRSIAHELELRVEASFRDEDMRQIVREEIQRALGQQVGQLGQGSQARLPTSILGLTHLSPRTFGWG